MNEKISKAEVAELSKKLKSLKITPTVKIEDFAKAVKNIDPNALIPFEKLPEEIKASVKALKEKEKRFHGSKISPLWFPFSMIDSPCGDKFGYLTSETVRQSSKLDFNVVTMSLMNQLGDLLGDTGRDVGPDSNIPAGFTYFGQFVDHDITLDVSSSLDVATDATSISNMRSPTLDLDNVYGRGPALDPYLYQFPNSPSTAVKFKLGKNTANGPGGPSTNGGGSAGMVVKTDFDVPRIEVTNTAVIGDPRNDENLFVSQFQMAMLRFHNAVVDLVVAAGFTGDIFVEAKKIVTHHYQWAVVNDYLKRICGASAVSNALGSIAAPVGSPFSMPVEFSVAAYRFGHSMVRDRYWVNHIQTNDSLADAFSMVRNPNVPVLSKRVVDFNAFFQTGINVPVFNFARKIDNFLANGLESIPGFSGLMAILARRNLRRGLAFGLPSGQATATALGVTPMTTAELTQNLPANEAAILNSNGGLLLTKTPLWYYILREAAVLGVGNNLGPLGAKIVAETFVRMLKRDGESYLNKSGGFVPFLPSDTTGDFTVTDIIKMSGVNVP